MSYTKKHFYVLAKNPDKDKRGNYQIIKFRFTENITELPFEKIASVDVDPNNKKSECNRITTTKY